MLTHRIPCTNLSKATIKPTAFLLFMLLKKLCWMRPILSGIPFSSRGHHGPAVHRTGGGQAAWEGAQARRPGARKRLPHLRGVPGSDGGAEWCVRGSFQYCQIGCICCNTGGSSHTAQGSREHLYLLISSRLIFTSNVQIFYSWESIDGKMP